MGHCCQLLADLQLCNSVVLLKMCLCVPMHAQQLCLASVVGEHVCCTGLLIACSNRVTPASYVSLRGMAKSLQWWPRVCLQALALVPSRANVC